MWDEFLSGSPDSLRLDSDTDEAINSFLREATESSPPVQVEEDSVSNCSSSNSSGVDLTFDLQPRKKTAVLWKQVVVTFDDENNIIEDEEKLEPRENNIVGYCGVCKLVFSSEAQLAEHRLAYAQKIACCHCCKTFATMSKLRIHHRKHSKEKPFQCRSCGKYYTHRQSLARHQLLYCPPLKEKVEEKSLSPVQEAPPRKRKACAEKEGEEQVKRPAVSSEEEETSCRICSKQFYDHQSLTNHHDYHLSHRECCHCHKVMGNKSKLLTHHRSHTKELPYQCQLCDKRFAENSTLRKHTATHGKRNFQCSVCSKAFVRKDYLAKHELIHRQTYKCSQCRFVCHDRSEIETHVSHEH